MDLQAYLWLYLGIALLLANLPWLSQRCLLVLDCAHKSAWLRLGEWGLMYLLAGLLGYLLEQRLMGTNHAQDWEFYVVTLSLFMVFAFPGFIYRYVR